ncbi:MAG: hypothetical protein DI582_03165 [Azospirillum brasilense]|nr:MAG: hypothetical protein DI582_03165 [Azospirillum brasilense]
MSFAQRERGGNLPVTARLLNTLVAQADASATGFLSGILEYENVHDTVREEVNQHHDLLEQAMATATRRLLTTEHAGAMAAYGLEKHAGWELPERISDLQERFRESEPVLRNALMEHKELAPRTRNYICEFYPAVLQNALEAAVVAEQEQQGGIRRI